MLGDGRVRASLIRLLLLAVMAVSTGCNAQEPVAQPIVSAVDSTLVIGTAITPPFEFYGPETGDLVGYDVDLATSIAKSLGRRLEWRVLAFADLLPALQAGDVDMVLAAMYITPEREAMVDFSHPYLETGLVMVVRHDTPFIDDPLALAGLNIGVKQGATGERWIDALAAQSDDPFTIFRYEKTQSSLEDLASGFLDIALNDRINTLYYMQTNPGVKIGSDILEPASLGIAVRQGDHELLYAIDVVLDDLAASGMMDELYARWIEP